MRMRGWRWGQYCKEGRKRKEKVKQIWMNRPRTFCEEQPVAGLGGAGACGWTDNSTTVLLLLLIWSCSSFAPPPHLLLLICSFSSSSPLLPLFLFLPILICSSSSSNAPLHFHLFQSLPICSSSSPKPLLSLSSTIVFYSNLQFQPYLIIFIIWSLSVMDKVYKESQRASTQTLKCDTICR